jgi:hypothetical protein
MMNIFSVVRIVAKSLSCFDTTLSTAFAFLFPFSLRFLILILLTEIRDASELEKNATQEMQKIRIRNNKVLFSKGMGIWGSKSLTLLLHC